MTKDILLQISGMQFGVEELPESEDAVEVITSGSYFERDGQRYIKYDEFQEDSEEVSKNLIKIRDDGMEVIKKGLTNVHMVFEKGKKNESYYQTPFGSLLIGISATHLEVQESEHELDIKVEYALEINYEFMADCFISIHAQSKE